MPPKDRKFGFNRAAYAPTANREASELSGYMDLGMHRKAVPLALKILQKPRMKLVDFEEAVSVLICAHPKLTQCVPTILKAYQRLNARSRKSVRSSLLSLYYHLSDYPKALLFVSRRPTTPFEFVHSLEIYMKVGLEEDAARLAAMGQRMMHRCKDTLEQGAVLGSLAHFFTHRGDYDKSITLWKLLPNDLSLGFDKFESIVKLHAAKGLHEIVESLKVLSELEKEGDAQFEIAYPGLHKKLIVNIRQQLKGFRKSFEMIILKKERAHYGLT